MRPIGFLQKTVAGGGSGASHYIFSATGTGTPGNIAITGAAANDILVLASLDASTSVDVGTILGTIGSGGGYKAHFSYVVITALDVANGYVSPTGSAAQWGYAIYRTGTIAAAVSNAYDDTGGFFSGASAGSPRVISGFTKNGSSKSLCWMFLTLGTNVSYTPSGGPFQRQLSSGNHVYIGDLDPSSYTNGTNYSWSYGGSAALGVAFEIR